MSHAAEKFFGEAGEYITRCRTLLAEGNELGLRELEGEVSKLCDIAAGLSPEERKENAKRLEQLSLELNALAKELAARHAAVGEQIHGLAKARRAGVAYRTAEASDKKDG